MPRNFSVRASAPEDELLVTGLLEVSYPSLMAGSYDNDVLAAALPMMTRAMPELLSAGTYYLAENDDSQIIGCGGWTRERPRDGEPERELAHIRHFGTHPQWVRLGIGRAIYDKCEEQARSAGIRRLECYSSLNAKNFYAALGFRVVRQMDIRMGETLRVPAVLMERTI